MIRVKLTANVLICGKRHLAGTVLELPDGQALALSCGGVAQLEKPEAPAPDPAPAASDPASVPAPAVKKAPAKKPTTKKKKAAGK